MANKEYTLLLTQAPNGGWVISKNGAAYMSDSLVAAYSNKSHMLTGLSDLIDDIKGQSDDRTA